MKKIIIILLLIILFLIIISKSSFTSTSENNIELVYNLYDTSFKNRFTLNDNTYKLDSVDMVYVMAMPQRIEYVTEQINKMGLHCKYLDAVKPSDLTKETIDKISEVNKPGTILYNLPTRLCHLLSFTMCCIDALKNGYKVIIIFEDDIIINVDNATLNNATTEFVNNSNLDLFYMGYCFLNCGQKMDKKEFKYLIKLYDPSLLCNHATCIKTKMLPNLINYCFPMKKPTDEMFTTYFHSKKINVCIPQTTYFDQVPRDQMESLNVSTNVLRHCR